MSLVYGFLAGVGICAALAALAIAAQRDRRQRRQIADLAGHLAAAQARETAAGQRLEAEMAMRLDLMNQSLEARERENRRLQAALSDLEPRARHDRLSRVHRDLGEADLFAFVKLRDELLTAAEIAEHYARRAKHVAEGGRPDEWPQWGQGGQGGVANSGAGGGAGAEG